MSFSKLTIGNKFPESVNVVIEIPRGSRNKYEYNEDTELIHLDRVLHSTLFYPSDYGFIPQTRSDDGDHVDILVLITQPTFPGCVLKARPIGALDMEDEAGHDWKILAVAQDDPYYGHIESIDQVNSQLKREIQHFFATYKQLEAGKSCTVRDWHDKKTALDVISKAHVAYKQ